MAIFSTISPQIAGVRIRHHSEHAQHHNRRRHAQRVSFLSCRVVQRREWGLLCRHGSATEIL
jgi:hypothetical protein